MYKRQFYLIPKQHELSRRIAELTEELEELKSEKDMLLHSLECTDDAGITAVKKDISAMEATLKKLSQQEEKYTAELNDALQQYAELKSQSAEFDSDKLQDARLAPVSYTHLDVYKRQDGGLPQIGQAAVFCAEMEVQ